MNIYKIFRLKGTERELIGALPERREKGRVTEESVNRYAESIFGRFMDESEMAVETEIFGGKSMLVTE